VQAQEVQQFLVDYFRTNQCEITDISNYHLTVQLTIDIDKQLMNRHFYWHYLEKIGGEPKTSQLTLYTENHDEDMSGELIHFGSPRLHQIFNSCKQTSSHVYQYEVCEEALIPWLVINFHISYQCDQQKSNLISLGLNLINGTIVEDFQTKIEQKQFSSKITELSYTLHPFITFPSGVKRLEKYVEDLLNSEDKNWVEQAYLRMNQDMQLLDSFYLDKNEEAYQSEREQIENLYEPKIDVEVVNGGVFYLSEAGAVAKP